MKRIVIAALFLAALSASVMAADTNPPLLCNTPAPAPCPPPPPAACEPPPPVCAPPPPICEAPAPVACPAPAPVQACAPAPAPACDAPVYSATRSRAPKVQQYKVVPVKKKVWEEETYVAEETRTIETEEVRTKIKRAKAPRLAKVFKDDRAVMVVHKDKDKVVPYVAKVKTTYQVPVTKTRKVAKEVEEVKIVPDRGRIFSW